MIRDLPTENDDIAIFHFQSAQHAVGVDAAIFHF